MATNHDQLMKELIATFPDQFLRLAAPEIAEKIDLGKLVLEPQEHYADTPSKRARHADLVGLESRATQLQDDRGARLNRIAAEQFSLR